MTTVQSFRRFQPLWYVGTESISKGWKSVDGLGEVFTVSDERADHHIVNVIIKINN